jgi:hypothetical protein
MDRLRLRALRTRLEPLANGVIVDGNEAIKTIAAVLFELTLPSSGEMQGEEISRADFDRRVGDIVARASRRALGSDGLTRPYGVQYRVGSNAVPPLTEDEKKQGEQIRKDAAARDRETEKLKALGDARFERLEQRLRDGEAKVGVDMGAEQPLDSRAIGDEGLKRTAE